MEQSATLFDNEYLQGFNERLEQFHVEQIEDLNRFFDELDSLHKEHTERMKSIIDELFNY